MKLLFPIRNAQSENPRVSARGFSCLVISDGKTRPSGLLPFEPSVKPFANEVGNYICQSGRNK